MSNPTISGNVDGHATHSTSIVQAALGEPCPDDKHCWHLATWQHSVMYHRDDVCCHCGHSRCVNTYDDYLKSRAGHGRFCP